ncbi:MAG TPA: TldD/PmbA family protein [Mycobacteriales bacterium]|nr:TldD/PmbA family protein [Mycobacteriales bacterium]
MTAREDLAARVLDLVRSVAGPAAEAEVHVSSQIRGLTRFARSFVHQNVVDTSERIRLRVLVDGSWATVSTDRADADALVATVESAVGAARLRPADAAFPGLAPATPLATTGNWDDATADATPDQRAAVVREFVAAAGGLEAAGFVETVRVEGVYANTRGQSVAGRCTGSAADGIARVPGADGVARQGSFRLGDLDGANLGRVAAAKARTGADPVDLPPGDYEVVLEPSCVADLLHFLLDYGFNGKMVAEGRSFLRPGERQFDPALRLWDGSGDEWSTVLPYDAEGTPRRRLDLIVDGVGAAVVHDRRTAAAAGGESTGHAVEGGERFGPEPAQPRVGAGPGGSTAELAAGLRRGLLVSDFWYTRILDPRTAVVTGLTRNGVWLVEDGQLVSPVSTLRFTQSYPDAVVPGAVLGVGSELAAVPVRGPEHLVVAPSLHLAGWHITGGAAG